MEEMIGIKDDGCKPEIRTLSESEEIVDYHGQTRRIKIRYRINLDKGRDKWFYKKGPVFEIMHFCVSPQNHGYGTRFMSQLISHLHEADINSIVLQAKNVRAARFWSRLGFKFHPWANSEELLMFLDINR
jgi:GNAT superfamily N-acetyltransferase